MSEWQKEWAHEQEDREWDWVDKHINAKKAFIIVEKERVGKKRVLDAFVQQIRNTICDTLCLDHCNAKRPITFCINVKP